jgi:hypothetical protein
MGRIAAIGRLRVGIERKVHEPVVPDIRDQISPAARMKLDRIRFDRLADAACRKLKEIGDASFDLAPAIRVGDKVNIVGLMFEDEPFQNLGARIPRLRNEIPIARAFEERLHTEARAPV